ncbi:hypothetical protein TEA_002942 [Camellia sinensis var. sinensis]|uniref:Uncharacterized protein n=1 Tax=Camellia sinensis var. sinensis TaxID=542762 RepID=A0A4S4CYI0_CAMSN|nr:hypothetical protein TEA_002942 [Camellia sinensis var. sinensis]
MPSNKQLNCFCQLWSSSNTSAFSALTNKINAWKPPKNLKKYGSWALVTGPTDGIGKGFAFQLARKALNLVLVGRNPEKLNDVSDSIRAKKTLQEQSQTHTLNELESGNFHRSVGFWSPYHLLKWHPHLKSRECYEKASETEKELKREIEDLTSKVPFLRFWTPFDHYHHRFTPCFSDIVLAASDDDSGKPVSNLVLVFAHKAILVSTHFNF